MSQVEDNCSLLQNATPVVVVAEAGTPMAAGTHKGVAEGYRPVLATAAVVPMAHGTVVCWHHETVRPDPQGAWAAEDDALLPGLWTLSSMLSGQDSLNCQLKGHHKA